MLLRLEVLEVARRPDLAQFLIGGLVRTDRDVSCGHIGDGGEQCAQLVIQPLLRNLAVRDRALERGDLIHQALCFRLVLARFSLADLLGGGVAAGLRLLQFLNRGAALLVQPQNLIQRLLGRVGAAVLQRRDEGVLVLANPFDVEQGAVLSAGNRGFPIRPSASLVIAFPIPTRNMPKRLAAASARGMREARSARRPRPTAVSGQPSGAPRAAICSSPFPSLTASSAGRV